MAVKNRAGGGGSNTGLIVTLVFFVLATVILGVMTYLGFDGQAELVKAKDAEVAKTKVMTEEKDWNRFQAWLLRRWINGDTSASIDKQTLVGQKRDFDKGNLAASKSQKDKADVEKFMTELSKEMPWDANKDADPPITFEKRLKDKDNKIAELSQTLNALQQQKAESDRLATEAREQLEAEKNIFKKTIEEIKTQNEKDRQSDRDTITALRKDLGLENEKKEKVNVALAETNKRLGTAESAQKRLQAQLDTSRKETREVRGVLDETQQRLTVIADKTGVDLHAAEAEALDAKAIKMLKAWTKPWKIIEMDQRGTNPYINMGSADGLTPQVTFSVHAEEPDRRLNQRAKGTVEVVRVIGSHLSQVRVTSVKDGKGDPLLKGDRLFNPTWDPNSKRHVALAGMADLGGDGTDNSEDFRRLMDRQNVVLDAWIDTKDEKAPKLVGKGVTANTDYLIVGESLEGVNNPRFRVPGYNAAFDRLATDMKTKAINNGVTVLTLRRYLDLIGYRAPKVVSTGAR